MTNVTDKMSSMTDKIADVIDKMINMTDMTDKINKRKLEVIKKRNLLKIYKISSKFILEE